MVAPLHDWYRHAKNDSHRKQSSGGSAALTRLPFLARAPAAGRPGASGGRTAPTAPSAPCRPPQFLPSPDGTARIAPTRSAGGRGRPPRVRLRLVSACVGRRPLGHRRDGGGAARERAGDAHDLPGLCRRRRNRNGTDSMTGRGGYAPDLGAGAKAFSIRATGFVNRGESKVRTPRKDGWNGARRSGSSYGK
jgi:hypothetical protein